MHVTDGRTDRITTPKTALAYARAVKTNPNTTKLALVKTQNMNLNSSSVRTAHTSVHMTVHSCVAQYSTEQFQQSFILQAIIIAQMLSNEH